MKARCIKPLALVLAISFMLAGCTTSQRIKLDMAENTQRVLDKFSDMMTPEQVLKDIAEVDLLQTMDVIDLEHRRVVNDENDTVDNIYVDNDGNTVYIAYEGYGEDSFAYFTKSRSMLDLKALYVDGVGNNRSVTISSDKYSVDFDDVEIDEKYGADSVYITISENQADDLGRSITYFLDDDKAYVSHACYYDNDGYHFYEAYEEEDTLTDYDDIKYERVDKAEPDKIIDELRADKSIKELVLLLGKHTLKYSIDDKGKKAWFISADIYAIFDNEAAADKLARAHQLEVNFVDDDRYSVVFEQNIIPLDASLGIVELAETEYNDYVFRAMSFSDDGAITELLPPSSVAPNY